MLFNIDYEIYYSYHICSTICYYQLYKSGKATIKINQEKALSDTVYILFNQREEGQDVERRRDKDMAPADIYRYNVKTEDGHVFKYPFATLDPEKFEIKDLRFVKKNAITIKQASEIQGFGFDTSDPKFPFRHVFVAELLPSQRYKVSEVTTYIGSDY